MSLSLAQQHIARAGQFQYWSQQDWQDFVKYSVDKSKLDTFCETRGQIAEGYAALELSQPFQRALLEVGVFGGAEFFQNIPCFYYCDDPHNFGYPIVRILMHRSSPDGIHELGEIVVFQTDEIARHILLRRPQDFAPGNFKTEYWGVVFGCRLQNNLISDPTTYEQITEIVNVGKVANALLKEMLPQGIAALALDYAGYPQKPNKRPQEMRQTLYEYYSDNNRLSHPSLSCADPLLAGGNIRRLPSDRVELVSSTIADYVGEDRLEETVAPI